MPVREGNRMNEFNRSSWKRIVRAVLVAVFALAGVKIASGQIATVTASVPYIAFGGTTTPGNVNAWTTEFAFTNLGLAPANLNIRWYGDSGQPLSVPVLGAARATTHQFVIAPNATLNFSLDNTQDALTGGWAALDITGSLRGQAIFHSDLTGRPEYSAAAPLVRHGAQVVVLLGGGVPVSTVPAPVSLALPFNNVGNITGLSFANVTNTNQTLALSYVDDTGAALMSQTIPLGPGAHTAFAASDPRVAGKKGAVIIQGDGSPYSAIAFVQGTGANSGTVTTFLPISD